MSSIFSQGYLVLDTKGVDDTLVCGLFFIFLAYFVHPLVESAYIRVRAHRAWRTIERGEAVEVTNYPLLQEIFIGRGKWDAQRVTTVLRVLFSLASWGLELSIGVPIIEGAVDLQNQPPPVTLEKMDDFDVWQVNSLEDLGYDGDWKNLPNMFEDHAKSRYYMENGAKHTGVINGDNIVAYWYTEPDDTLFYYIVDSVTTVEGLLCADDVASTSMDVYHGGVLWGIASECDNGPRLASDLLSRNERKRVPPPTIIMKRSDGVVFLIVEETSHSLSFLYSVWAVRTDDGNATELQHEFHIAATMRLAEAVITGIVQGEPSGGSCFGLLRKYSENRELHNSACDAERAVPFGERPCRYRTANIQDTEIIPLGLTIAAIGLPCFACLVVLASIGVTWSVCSYSNVGVDVYDRDELVRAVSISGAATGDTSPASMRVLVRREDEGNINVEVSNESSAWRRFAWVVSGGLLGLVLLASWGLELSMELSLHSGMADTLGRPPPVTLRPIDGVDNWKVTTREDLGYDKTWTDLLTIFEDHNKSRDHMETGVMHAGVFNVDATADVLFNEADEGVSVAWGSTPEP